MGDTLVQKRPQLGPRKVTLIESILSKHVPKTWTTFRKNTAKVVVFGFTSRHPPSRTPNFMLQNNHFQKYFWTPGHKVDSGPTRPFGTVYANENKAKATNTKPTQKRKATTRRTQTPKKGRVRWGGAIGESKDKKRGLERPEAKKITNVDENNLSDVIVWCCSLHETEAKKQAKKDKQKTRKHNITENKEVRKQEKDKRERERERERERKGEVRQAREKQRRTLKNEQKYPLFQGKELIGPKHKKKHKTTKIKQNKKTRRV